jgi:hypothetical protein
MTKGSVFIFISVLCLCAIPVLSSAEDLFPPVWRGEWSTTSQVWEFSEPNDGQADLDGDTLPDGVEPDGFPRGGQPFLPSTRLWIWPETGAEWLPEDQPLQYEDNQWVGIGVWPLSGYMDVLVDNHDPHPENIKLIWVQITWRPNMEDEGINFEYFDPDPVADPVVVNEYFYTPTDPLGWRTTAFFWQLPFNPPDELFRFGGDIHVDELVVDTWCVPVPEPALLAIAACGLLLLRRRAK